MRFHQEQRFEGSWRWVWAGAMLGRGTVATIALLGGAAATGDDLTPTLLILTGLEVVALLGLILILRTPVIVEVTDESIRVHGPPFFGEEILAVDVTSVEEVTSGLRRRYGAGVGKRYGDRRARYTVGDDTGVVVVRSN